ncbi:hypothetical protein B0T20DRAFT_347475 [Sordaria brevicollis]|uniref:Uncharacterized protein n=1 Tax=Sordaria brevicollis TaxID=83679 RepID=A0AAE0PIP9_SORBR|nr:hypothetical protein B0T20DRAFT_347475 [Sordaria brevicollis]
MTTLRWELFLTEDPRRGTYDLGIAYEAPGNQKTEREARKIAAFRRLHKQCIGDKIKGPVKKGTFATEEWKDGSLVINGACIRKLTKIVTQTRYSGATQLVSYKLYFDSLQDANRLASVVGFASYPSVENGRWFFTMPTRIRDDTDEWESYLNPAKEREKSRQQPGH